MSTNIIKIQSPLENVLYKTRVQKKTVTTTTQINLKHLIKNLNKIA